MRELVRTKKGRIIIVGAALAAVLSAGACAAFFFLSGGAEGADAFFGGGMDGGFQTDGNAVMASGLTAASVTQESFEVENLETKLLIEEVYIASNEEITEGSRVLKLSEESVEAARKELEKKLRQAELDCRAGAIEYEQSRITAGYDRDSALLAGKQAQGVYDAAVSDLKAGVEKAEKELAEAEKKIVEYQDAVDSGSLYDYYGVGEYEALYEENKKLLMDKMEEWGVSWSQVTGVGAGQSGSQSQDGSQSGSQSQSAGQSQSGSQSAAATVSVGTVSGGNAGYAGILSSLYRVLEQNLADSEQARSDYEDAALNTEFELQTLQLSLSSLEKALAEAKKSYETRVLEAELAYETALAGAERAEADYETALEKAESDYQTLRDEMEDAQTNLELFESSVGDGYYHSAGSGTVLRGMVRAGEELASEAPILLYTNPDVITVTASVDQSDIAKLAVGDQALVQSADYGSLQGTITAISPVAASESRTNVTYSVTVTLSGDTKHVAANKTVTVLFGIGGETDEKEGN